MCKVYKLPKHIVRRSGLRLACRRLPPPHGSRSSHSAHLVARHPRHHRHCHIADPSDLECRRKGRLRIRSYRFLAPTPSVQSFTCSRENVNFMSVLDRLDANRYARSLTMPTLPASRLHKTMMCYHLHFPEPPLQLSQIGSHLLTYYSVFIVRNGRCTVSSAPGACYRDSIAHGIRCSIGKSSKYQKVQLGPRNNCGSVGHRRRPVYQKCSRTSLLLPWRVF